MNSSNPTIEIIAGDITTVDVDVIVNAANERLAAGAGVCGAIFAAAGHGELTESCRSIGGCETGSAVVTPSHRLAERQISHIIHAVGPVWDADDPDTSDRLLAGAYRSSLRLAEEIGAASIAFPCISTGIYGFPAERAAAIAVAEVVGHVGQLQRVLLVAFSEQDRAVLTAALDSQR